MITPAERAELLRMIADCTRNAAYITRGNLRMRAAELEAKAAQVRVASTNEDPSSAPTPVSPPPGCESGGRPVVGSLHTMRLYQSIHDHAGREVPMVVKEDHDRLVAWLDAEIAKRDRRIEDLFKEIGNKDAIIETTSKRMREYAEELNRLSGLRTQLNDQRKGAEKAEADAAVLREALEAEQKGECVYTTCLETPGCDYAKEGFDDGNFHMKRNCVGRAKRRADALATGAGEKLLAELEKLRAFVAAWDDYARGFASVEDGHRLWIAARAARAALDGGAS